MYNCKNDQILSFTSYELQEYGVSVENIFSVESSACPSYEDIVKMPNKVLLWCGKTARTEFEF